MTEFDAYIRRAGRLSKYVESQMDKPWLEWPTVRELASRYHCTQDEIVGIVEDCKHLDLIVGMVTYSGHGDFDNQGDYRVEWFD